MATLTDGERKVISLAWQCFKTVPEVDYKRLQELGNYKTAASATSCYLAARKKMLNPPTSTDPNTPIKITSGENKVLVLAWQSFKAPPTVDYKKLARLGSYKTAASATSCYLAARKKLLSSSSSSSATTTSNGDGGVRPSPVAGRKRKVDGKDADADADGDASTLTPKRRVKKAKVKDDSGEDGDMESDVKKPVGGDDGEAEMNVKKEAEMDDGETNVNAVAVKREHEGDENEEGGEVMAHVFDTAKEYLAENADGIVSAETGALSAAEQNEDAG